MKKEEARCHLTDKKWMQAEIAKCDLEHSECEENRSCRKEAQKKQQKRQAACQQQ